jgi:hypothetical protein
MKALGKGSLASIIKVILTIIWIVLWVALICVGVGTLVYIVFLTLVGTGVVDGPLPLGEDAHLSIGGNPIDLTYNNLGGATWPLVLPGMTTALVAVGGARIVVDRLRRLFDTFTSGEPFRRENARHLRVIWITMLVVEISRYVLFAAFGAIVAILGHPDSSTLKFDGEVNFTNWMAILILIVLAEVFREGARLKEEQELTI